MRFQSLRRKCPAQPQISHLQRVVLRDKDIGRFEISVHDLLVMHMFECRGDLDDVVPDLGLLKGDLLLDVTLYQFLEVPLFCPLGYDEKLVVVCEAIDVLDDVGVLQGLHQLHLFEALVALLRVHHVEYLCHEEGTLISLTATGRPWEFSPQ